MVLIVLPAMLYGFLHVNPVQQHVADRVANYFSEELDAEIVIGGVDFRLFRSVVLKDVRIEDQQKESLLVAKSLALKLNNFSLRKKEADIQELLLDEASLNMYKEKNQEHHNFQFIADYFSQMESDRNGEKWMFSIDAFRIKDADVRYRDVNGSKADHGFSYTDFHLQNLNLAIHDIRLTDSLRSFRLDHLKYKDLQGFEMNRMAASVNLSDKYIVLDHVVVETAGTYIDGRLEMHAEELSDLTSLHDKGDFVVHFNDSRVDLSDIGHYYRPLYGVRDVMEIKGTIRGDDNRVTGEEVRLAYGENTEFLGDFTLSDIGLEDPPFLDMQIKRLQSRVSDIRSFPLPLSRENEHISLPDYLDRLGDISFSGNLAWRNNDFYAKGILNTMLGYLETDISLKTEKGMDGFDYQGMLATESFQLGKLYGRDGLPDELTMEAILTGSGLGAEGLQMNINGNISSVTLDGLEYQDIYLDGDFMNQKFDGQLQVNDEKLKFDFNGLVDFESEIPEFHFYAGITHANLTGMNVFQRDDAFGSSLSANVSVNARAASFDEMEGELVVSDIRYSEIPLDASEPDLAPMIYTKDSIYVNNTIWSEDNRHFRVRSDFADLDVHGNITFNRLWESLRTFAGSYLPSLELTPFAESELSSDYAQELDFFLQLKDTRLLSELFMPALEVSDGSWISGTFNASDGILNVEGRADTLTLAGRKLYSYHLLGKNDQQHYVISMTSDRLTLAENRYLKDFSLDNKLQQDSMVSEIRWGADDSDDNRGIIKGYTHFYDGQRVVVTIPESEALINGNIWRFNKDNEIFLNSNRVEIHQLRAYHEDQFIRADGVLSAEEEDRMGLSFSNFNVAYTDVLLGSSNFTFGGMLDGYLSFTGSSQPTGIAAEVVVKDFAFNNEPLGDLELQSRWNDAKQAFEVNTAVTCHESADSSQPLIVTGNIYTGNHDQNFDLDIDLTNFKMSVWGRYLQSFAENFRGTASGNLRMDGPFNRPQLSGDLQLERMGMHIPYLNTSYTFAHELKIEKDRFHFEDLVLNDTLGNTARVHGAIMHDYFRDFAVDIELSPEEMIIFNTTAASEEVYFGTAFLSGLAHIHGPTNDITMDVSARTERGTNVMMPLNYTGDIRERHFISFVSPEDKANGNGFVQTRPESYLTLNFDLEVTPDAEVELFFDSQFGDILRGRGSGALNLEIAPDGSFNIYGDYFIEEGEYLFSLQNIINKRFRIEQGSNIRWTGDINDADVDLRAIYRLRTSLYDLLAGSGIDDETANQFRRRVPVETVLVLEDKLFNPNISFDIDVPGGDDNTRELIEREITTDQEMNRQVFSLLVLNRFMPRDQYAALGYGMGATSSELLSHQLSNWLTQISSDFDIGVNYRPGDEITSQEVELALSTQLFDDRVLIDGNFGVAGSQTATGHQARGANQIIGDVNVEVKITPEGKFRVKAFNRSNTFDIIHTNAPYTQGIGLFYRREFDRLDELFRRQPQMEHIPVIEGDQADDDKSPESPEISRTP